MLLLKNGQYDQALRDVNSRLDKKPRDRLLLEELLILLLANNDLGVRRDVLEVQKRLDAVGAGRQLLMDQSKNRLPQVRLQTAYALGALADPTSLGVLKTLAEDQESAVRAEAIHALGKVKNARAKGLLMIHLRDGDWRVRAESADALAQLHDPEATGQLLRAAADPDDYVRMQVRQAVIALAAPSQVDHYLDAAKSEVPAKRIAAALALAKLRHPAAVPLLYDLLEDKGSEDRVPLAQSLVAMGVNPVDAQFAAILKSEKDAKVRELLVRYSQTPRP